MGFLTREKHRSPVKGNVCGQNGWRRPLLIRRRQHAHLAIDGTHLWWPLGEMLGNHGEMVKDRHISTYRWWRGLTGASSDGSNAAE
jgi:hypothetical protein